MNIIIIAVSINYYCILKHFGQVLEYHFYFSGRIASQAYQIWTKTWSDNQQIGQTRNFNK